MKVLLIGDPHATAAELDDCRALFAHVEDILKKDPHDFVIILGDLYHTHAIMHVEVMAFWNKTLQALAKLTQVICLVGNHDMPGNAGSKSHALMAHEDLENVRIISHPTVGVIPGVAMFPYMHDKFLDWAEESSFKDDGIHTLICHQTFTGAQYENGFYAKDGIEPDGVPVANVISGHIHKPSVLGKVWYPGAPRWRTLSDANTDRFLESIEFTEGMSGYKKLQSYPTAGVCRSVVHIVLEEHNATNKELEIPNNCDVRIDLKGSLAWIEQKKLALAGKAKLRTFPNRGKEVVVKESDGIAAALHKFIDSYVPKHGSSKEDLRRLVAERIGL